MYTECAGGGQVSTKSRGATNIGAHSKTCGRSTRAFFECWATHIFSRPRSLRNRAPRKSEPGNVQPTKITRTTKRKLQRLDAYDPVRADCTLKAAYPALRTRRTRLPYHRALLLQTVLHRVHEKKKKKTYLRTPCASAFCLGAKI